MTVSRSFVDAYLRAREREGRILPDDVVRRLPHLPEGDDRRAEWKLRADSSDRLIGHLARIHRPLIVHDLGCGNGWLTARLAALDNATVVGFDVNDEELAQARRVFAGRPRLTFVLAEAAVHGVADVVVLASVLQYIANPSALLRELSAALAPEGAIHVLDTPLYDQADIAAARERTRQHFRSIGVPEMIVRYHHHGWSVLAGLDYAVLYDPAALRHRLARRVLHKPRSPFPWVRITSGTRRVSRSAPAV